MVAGNSGSQIVLKTSDGYENINVSDVRSVTVTVLNSPGSTETPVTKMFTGIRVGPILNTLGLHNPWEPGTAASALVTGQVVLQLDSRSLRTRSFNILNHRLLIDASFTEVNYQTGEKLDRAWLEKQ